MLSVVLGIAMNSLLPNRLPGPDLLAALAIVLGYWFVYGSFLHLVCWALRGSGHYLETLSVSIQVLATLYVVTSFFSLLAVAVISIPNVGALIGRLPFIGEPVVDEPPLIFFLLGTLALSIYMPLSLRAVHKFGWLRTAVIFLIPYLLVWLSILFYWSTGVMRSLW